MDADKTYRFEIRLLLGLVFVAFLAFIGFRYWQEKPARNMLDRLDRATQSFEKQPARNRDFKAAPRPITPKPITPSPVMPRPISPPTVGLGAGASPAPSTRKQQSRNDYCTKIGDKCNCGLDVPKEEADLFCQGKTDETFDAMSDRRRPLR